MRALIRVDLKADSRSKQATREVWREFWSTLKVGPRRRRAAHEVSGGPKSGPLTSCAALRLLVRCHLPAFPGRRLRFFVQLSIADGFGPGRGAGQEFRRDRHLDGRS